MTIGQDVPCKQEPSSQDCPEFVDLEQCAAALEKDAAANGGSTFPGFSDLIGDDTSDAIITSDAFKDLFSEISDFPSEFMKDFDFDGDNKNNIALDDLQTQPATHMSHSQNPRNITPSSMYCPTNTTNPNTVGQTMSELSPAAQTLKQMAEQHQHKTQLGLNYASHARNPNQPTQTAATPPQPSTPNIKQEIVYSPGGNPGTPQGNTRLTGGYSPYGSPSSNHNNVNNNNNSNNNGANNNAANSNPNNSTNNNNGPRSQTQPPQQKPQPPRPPSGPGPPNHSNHSQATLQINQAQQLHISQSQGQPIQQVTMAQNLQTDMKPTSISVAAHQGMYFSQQNTGPTDTSYCAVSQSQTINFTQQTLRQRAAAARQHAHPHPHAHHQQGLPVLRPPPEYQSAGMNSNNTTGGPNIGVGAGIPNQQQSSLIHSMLGQQPHRFSSAPQQQRVVAANRMAQQSMPPSGPMMRPQQPNSGMYITSSAAAAHAVALQQQQQQQQQRLSQFNNQSMLRALRPPQQISPVVQIPGQNAMDNNEWRQHIMMGHSNTAASHQSRSGGFLHQAQGVLFGAGNMQMAAGQMQQQQVQQPNLSNNPTRLMTPPPQQAQQPQPHQTMSLQQNTPQMSLNLHMSQHMSQFPRQHMQQPSQQQQQQQQHCGASGMNYNTGGAPTNSVPNPNNNNSYATSGVNTSTSSNSNSSNNSAVYQSSAVMNNPNSNANSNTSYMSPQLPSDLNLDFLEQLPSSQLDSSQITHDILSSFDATASFNLHDIL